MKIKERVVGPGLFKIEKGIPIPEKRTRMGGSIYPFDKMKVGDSFHLGDKARNYGEAHTVMIKAYLYGRYHNKKFSVRKVEDGYRVWRTK